MKKLQNVRFVLFAALLLGMAACKSSTTDTVYTNGPVGSTTNIKTGTIMQQNAPGTPATSGTLLVVQDSQNNQFLKLNSDFTSGFSTGTVAVYFAKDKTEIKTQRTAAATNVQALGFVTKGGEQYIKINTPAGYSYVVFYCETAEVNFGAAQLQ